jgi:hypothetical protein
MNNVRPFVEGDIPAVADLHRSVFGTGDHPSRRGLDRYQKYFDEVFLHQPWHGAGLSSLVYEEDGGRLSGFLGVVPRRMLMGGQPVQMAVCSQFVVRPERRGLVGLRLLKALFEGPQDLSMTDEANEITRKIWEGRGGTTAVLYSVHWTRPLRPAQSALAVVSRHRRLATLARLAGPVARIVDTLAAGIARRHVRPSTPSASAEDLSEAVFLAYLPQFAGTCALRPAYDEPSLKWALERAAQRAGEGRFQKVVVRERPDEIAGWYLYHVDPRGIGEVLQIVAARHSIHAMVDHLIDHAWRQGATALAGRAEPALIQALSDKRCRFHRRGPWMLVHSKHPELLRAIHRGEAFLTRLEGEWCLRFSSSTTS